MKAWFEAFVFTLPNSNSVHKSHNGRRRRVLSFGV